MWLETRDLNLKRPSKKLAEKRIGPYEITEVISPNAVKLKLPKTIRIHPVVNVSRIRPYNPSRIPNHRTPPSPPVEIDGEFEFEVEQILDSRLSRGRLEYLVKWQNYTEEHNTWEPESNVKNAPRRINVTFAELKFRPYENFTRTAQNIFSRLEVET